MKKAIVDVYKDDYTFFEKLMKQNGWDYEWANQGEEFPDLDEEDP